MKNLLFLALLFSYSTIFSGSEITIDISISEGAFEEFVVYHPIEGSYFEGAKIVMNTDQNGEAKVSFSSSSPGFCYIFFHRNLTFDSWNVVQLFVYPGQSYGLEFKDSQDINSRIMRCSNIIENKFLSERKRINLLQLHNRLNPESLFLSDSEEGWYQKILSMRETEMLEIGLLERTAVVSVPFAKAVKADIHYYYACLIHELVTKTLFSNKNDDDVNVMVSLMIENEIHDSDQYEQWGHSSLWYLKYLRQRFYYYQITNQKALADHYRGYNNQTEAYWNLLYEVMDEKALEVYLANHLDDLCIKEAFNEDMFQLYRRFSIEYPTSVFMPMLKDKVEPQIRQVTLPK